MEFIAQILTNAHQVGILINDDVMTVSYSAKSYLVLISKINDIVEIGCNATHSIDGNLIPT